MATFAAVALNPNEPVSMATLLSLVQLTEFVMLMPRFMASVPSSWVEYQQDQHRLYQHTLVDPLLHTRTWKLRTENSRQVMFYIRGTQPNQRCHLVSFVVSSSTGLLYITLAFSNKFSETTALSNIQLVAFSRKCYSNVRALL